MAGERTCVCDEPVELPDMTCGACGLRRLGDDLTKTQTEDLVEVLAYSLLDDPPERPRELFRRRHGRKRPRREAPR